MSAEIIVIGTSTGGLKALQTLLCGLPSSFPVPIAIVQHRGKVTDDGLSEFLSEFSCLPISEPEDKQPLLPGYVYLAPRDYHLLIEDRSFALSTDPPEAFARPSIDVLFESAADDFQERTIGVILTGANRDGARGLAAIKSRGGLTIVENPETASCGELPAAAIQRTAPDWIVSLHDIAPLLLRLTEDHRAERPAARRGPEAAIHYGS
ncbi:MAG TPA: chemotaxis protein CheB [Pyrinomonadaceae bacterium]|jgi:two-component system chemotaxis response regulator CheB